MSRGTNLLLFGTSAAIALALGEVGARVLLPAPPQVSVQASSGADARLAREQKEHADFTIQSFIHDEPSFYLDTPTGRRLRANARAVIENHGLCGCRVELRTNALGYRNPEIGPKTKKRVLFLGDSITLADYLDESETFVRRVETLSRETATPLETVNAGVGAIGLANELAILKETGLGIHPDVVVLDFYLNDVEASRGITMLTLPKALAWSRLAQHAALLLPSLGGASRAGSSEIPATLLEEWRAQTEKAFPPGKPGEPRTSRDAFNRRIQKSFDDWGSAWSEGAWERMEPLFAELAQLSIEHHFDLRFVVFPVRLQVEADYVYDFPQQKLAAAATRLGVPVLDLLPVLRSAYRADADKALPLFFDHCHHTAHGSEIVARSLTAFLMH